ncbi:type II secretion system protein N [Marinobacter bryozoorum]|uniref:type II secretion system protein N n=1 Tax=Marinobacter bryozoorum TaxID=256324 RepID=UPI002003AF94|nr:type II secretion system protein N [Marinobacter bryozoorum]MCK7544840.1 type II secretion system protein N [Marinobacter bryozoorum]
MTDSSSRPFIRPAKVILLVLLMLLVYAVALVAWLPAGWVWAQASEHVSLPPGVSVQQVSGPLWNGAARIEVQRKPVRVEWQLTWPDVMTMRQPVAVKLETVSSRVDGDLAFDWPGSVTANLTGRLHIPEFADLIRQSGGALLEGDVILDRLRVAVTDQQLESATGLARWPGGNVSWPMGNRRETAVFPPMQATLTESVDGFLLRISEQGKAEPAAEAGLALDGMMNIRVYKRMVDLAGQSWSSSAQPGDVIFQVQQPLLPGGRP